MRIAKKTKLSPEEVVKKAAEFFVAGYGLKVKEQTPTCVYLEGGDGGVDVSTCAEAKGSEVEVLSRGWDYQAKEFLSKLG